MSIPHSAFSNAHCLRCACGIFCVYAGYAFSPTPVAARQISLTRVFLSWRGSPFSSKNAFDAQVHTNLQINDLQNSCNIPYLGQDSHAHRPAELPSFLITIFGLLRDGDAGMSGRRSANGKYLLKHNLSNPKPRQYAPCAQLGLVALIQRPLSEYSTSASFARRCISGVFSRSVRLSIAALSGAAMIASYNPSLVAVMALARIGYRQLRAAWPIDPRSRPVIVGPQARGITRAPSARRYC